MGQSASNQDTSEPDETLISLVGARVIRGPNWKWSKQDGGVGHLGTVKKFEGAKGVEVAWDNGTSGNYRYHGAYDLKILDSGPAGIKHEGSTCSGCGEKPIFGTRWDCSECTNYQLCSTCYHGDKHDLRHKFFCIDLPGRISKLVDTRRRSKKISASGLFPGAKVIRSFDWEWGSQDGLVAGVITGIEEWGDSSPRSAARVEWQTGMKNLYRVGFKGKVDIQAVVPEEGFSFYRDHLPILGRSIPRERRDGLAIGDRVKISLDSETVKLMQQGYGGCNDDMLKEVLSNSGTISAFRGNKGVLVSYPSKNCWLLNPAVLARDDSDCQTGTSTDSNAPFQVGDTVRILSDLGRVMLLQLGHGGWLDPMKLTLGKVGTVKNIDSDGDLEIEVLGMTWIFNPLCVVKVEDIESELSGHLVDLLKSLVELQVSTEESKEVRLLKAAAAKDLQKVKGLVSEGGIQINAIIEGVTALHAASQNGAAEVVSFLIRSGAELEIKGKGDIRAIHQAAFGGHQAVIRILSQAGADINARDGNGYSPLHVAVNHGNIDAVKCLLMLKAHPSLQDSFGDTPLHDAISKQLEDMVKLLLDSQADISVTNNRGFNCLHHAALKGFTLAVKAMLAKGLDPMLINEKKEDGFTALHLAAFNNHVEIANLLITQGKANIDIQNKGLETSLHLAVQGQHFEAVQLLVEYGANLDITDNEGDTPLHDAVRFHTILQLKELREVGEVGVLLMAMGLPDSEKKPSASIACFLAAHGADLSFKNKKDQTPLDLCLDPNLTMALSEWHVPQARVSTGNQAAKIGAAVAAPDSATKAVAATVDDEAVAQSENNCFVCSDMARDILFTPCCHIVTCSQCSQRVKRCLICKEQVQSRIQIKNCSVCSEKKSSVLFKPCGHICACDDCARPLKSCFQCNSPIEECVQYADLCGFKNSAKEQKSNKFTNNNNVDNEDVNELRKQLTEMQEEMMCPICFDRKRNLAFSCGHVTCQLCGDRVQECPMCRKPIVKRVLLY